jgi:hypothetical protein
MNTESDVSASFLQKNHTFHHPIGGLDIGRRKYGSTPGPNQTKMSTLPEATISAPEPCCSWE